MRFFQQTIRLYQNAYTGLSPATWLLSLVLLINRSGTMVIPFMTVYLTQQLHFSIANAGLVMACFGAGSIVGALLGGWLSDKIGFYQVQFWSLFLNGLLFFLLGQLHTFAQISALAFVQGSVADAFRPANSIAIATYSSVENRTRSYALNRLAVNLGWTLGPAMGGILASISYQFLFWVDGASCILAALIMRAALPPVPAPVKLPSHHEQKRTDSVAKDHIYLWFILFATITFICLFQFSSMIPLFFKEVLNMEEWRIGLTMAFNGILIVLVEMVMVFRLEGKRPNLVYVTYGALFVSCSYFVINLSTYFHFFTILFMFIITFGEMFCLPFMNSFWISRSKEYNRGQYASLYTISYSVANIASPTAGAFVIQHIGFKFWWLITACTCLLAATGFIWLQKRIANRALSYKNC